MTRGSGSPPGSEARRTREAHGLAVLLLAAALGVGTGAALLGRGGPPFPPPPDPRVRAALSPRAPERAALAPKLSSGLPLSLNTADVETLRALPGIGPTLAERIVAFRREHGPFRSVEDLLHVPGIGPGRWERIRPALRVAGEGP